jgi:hypothetical protein
MPLKYIPRFVEEYEEKPRAKSTSLKALCQWLGTNELLNDL